MILLNGIKIEPTIFPDGTQQVWKLDEKYLDKEPLNYCVWLYESDTEIMTLYHLNLLLEKISNKTKYLCIPFLPYSRQDKDISNESTFGLQCLAGMLNRMYYWDKIVTFDVHSENAIQWIDRLVSYNLSYELLLEQEKIVYDYYILPDKGAFDRYSPLLDSAKCLYGNKVRNQSTGKIESYTLSSSVSLKNKRCLVIDDICDGGATFNILAESLWGDIHEDYPLVLNLFVTHGIFSKGLDELAANYGRIYTTNSLAKYYDGEFEKQNEDILKVFKVWI